MVLLSWNIKTVHNDRHCAICYLVFVLKKKSSWTKWSNTLPRLLLFFYSSIATDLQIWFQFHCFTVLGNLKLLDYFSFTSRSRGSGSKKTWKHRKFWGGERGQNMVCPSLGVEIWAARLHRIRWFRFWLCLLFIDPSWSSFFACPVWSFCLDKHVNEYNLFFKQSFQVCWLFSFCFTHWKSMGRVSTHHTHYIQFVQLLSPQVWLQSFLKCHLVFPPTLIDHVLFRIIQDLFFRSCVHNENGALTQSDLVFTQE